MWFVWFGGVGFGVWCFRQSVTDSCSFLCCGVRCVLSRVSGLGCRVRGLRVGGGGLGTEVNLFV
jgi:hypothetical protein